MICGFGKPLMSLLGYSPAGVKWAAPPITGLLHALALKFFNCLIRRALDHLAYAVPIV